MHLLLSLSLSALPAQVLPFPGRPGPGASTPSLPAADAALVVEARAGSRTAQQALYRRHVGRVQSRIARLLGRSAEADDVVQDAFVWAFRDLGQLAEPEHFGAWVCGIAVHQVHRRLRRRSLLRRLGLDRGSDDLTLAHVADPAAGPFVHVMLKQLDIGLSRLPTAHRLAWMLRHVEGCPLEEVAQQCGVSVATVKRHLGRAEQELRRHIDFELEVSQDSNDKPGAP